MSFFHCYVEGEDAGIRANGDGDGDGDDDVYVDGGGPRARAEDFFGLWVEVHATCPYKLLCRS